MFKFGKRLYYDVTTGLIVFEIGEQRYDFEVSIMSVEQDIATFNTLSERNRDSFDVLELEYGQYAQDFAECNGYRVNPQTKELEFSYPDPNEPEQPPVFQKALSEQIKDLELKTDEAIMELSMVIALGGMG